MSNTRAITNRITERITSRITERGPTPLGIRGGLNMGCFNFTGSNYASIAALSENLIGGGGSFTVSCRIKAPAYDGLVAYPISIWGDGDNYTGAYAPKNLSQQTRINFVVAASAYQADGTVDAPTEWGTYRITWSASSKIGCIYINGVLSRGTSVFASGFAAVAATLFCIGNRGDLAYDFGGGKLADIRIYNAVVTPDHSIPATSESNVVDWWITPKPDGSIVGEINGNTLVTTGNSLYSASGGPGLPWWPS